MSTTIELPNVEYTQDFIEMCATLRFQRQKEKDEATSIKINAQKQKNNAQLVEDNQSAIEIEKQMHIDGLTDLINQAQQGLENT